MSRSWSLSRFWCCDRRRRDRSNNCNPSIGNDRPSLPTFASREEFRTFCLSPEFKRAHAVNVPLCLYVLDQFRADADVVAAVFHNLSEPTFRQLVGARSIEWMAALLEDHLDRPDICYRVCERLKPDDVAARPALFALATRPPHHEYAVRALGVEHTPWCTLLDMLHREAHGNCVTLALSFLAVNTALSDVRDDMLRQHADAELRERIDALRPKYRGSHVDEYVRSIAQHFGWTLAELPPCARAESALRFVGDAECVVQDVIVRFRRPMAYDEIETFVLSVAEPMGFTPVWFSHLNCLRVVRVKVPRLSAIEQDVLKAALESFSDLVDTCEYNHVAYAAAA